MNDWRRDVLTYWFGLEPSLGRDVFMQLVYGIRTSLGIAVAATLIITTCGIVIGIHGGAARVRTYLTYGVAFGWSRVQDGR